MTGQAPASGGPVAGDPLAGPPAGPGAGGGPPWQRAHPLSPLVRSWAAAAVAVGIVVNGFYDRLAGSQNAQGPDLPLPVPFQLIGVLLVALTALAVNVVSWLNTTYRVTGDAVQLRSGVLSRSFRQAALDRIQAVDIVQPLAGRLVGVCELRVEVAGGSGSDVRIAYLTRSHAHQLRDDILASAAGVGREERPRVPTAPRAADPAGESDVPVVTVPVGRLLASLVLSAPSLALLGAVALAVAAAASGRPMFFWAFGGLPGLAAFYFTRFSQSFNFRVSSGSEGLRVRAGLTETRAATIPPGRVQAVLVEQPLLWRTRGWWSVRLGVAGYGDEESTRTTLLPVGPRQDVLWALRQVVPDIGTEEPVRLFEHAMTGQGPDGGFTTSPRRARWLDPLTWRRNGYAVTRTVLLARSGRWTRRLVVVPHERVQSLAVVRGPIQRAARLATVQLHSTPGPVAPVVAHMDEEAAARLMSEQSVRARTARASDTTERWLSRRDPTA